MEKPESDIPRRLSVVGLGLSILSLDLLSKSWIQQHLVMGSSWQVSNFLYFSHVKNNGALLGFLAGHPLMLAGISLIIALVLVGLSWKIQSDWPAFIILGLLLGGTLGNFWERLTLGGVTDFIDLRWQGQNIWPIFNLADLAIDLALLVFLSWRLSLRWQADP